MAQHDYVIDNSTGANVRADINSALQAIVTNNSGSSAPSSTFPFMLFADSAAGTMKIRNAADNAFIELFQLDGTFTLEDGSASTPALAFRDDLDTGIFSDAANEFNVATGGVERFSCSNAAFVVNQTGADVDFRIESDTNTHAFFLQASDSRIGINVSSPTSPLHISGGSDNTILQIVSTDAGAFMTAIDNTGSGSFGQQGAETVITCDSGASVGSSAIVFQIDGNSEKMRIDSSGRLLAGSTSVSNNGRIQGFIAHGSTAGESGLVSVDTTAMAAGVGGEVSFMAKTDTGGTYNYVGHVRGIKENGTDSNTACALTFHTRPTLTAPQERMRIDSVGNILVGRTDTSINTSNYGIVLSAEGLLKVGVNVNASNNVARFFGNSGRADIRGDGDLENTNGRYSQVSDIKYKENIVDANSQWNDIKAIKVRNFNYKSSTGWSTHKQIGIVAQELEVTSPSLVNTSYDTENDESYKSVAQSIVYMKAVKCLQEAMAKIETLETKVAALEAA